VLDGASGTKLRIDNLTDAAGSQDPPQGGAATGMGGTAPGPGGPGPVPWLATLGGGMLLAAAGGFGLRRSRRSAAAEREHVGG
jgi:LPXTG-motif cell wall-anchored protein